ncbi:hypothetical protein BGZ94_007189 [Podila epigama]|nr:hypothetical protein BGZ94_007189 [Podila epigama]
MTTLSSFPAGTSSTAPSNLSSPAAEALLSRARRLSNNAYKQSNTLPISFAEGEDPAALLSTSYTSTTNPNSDLHERHRNSFNSYIREQNRKRSLQPLPQKRPSSSSSSKSTNSPDESATLVESPVSLTPLDNASSPSEHPTAAVIVVSPSEHQEEKSREHQQTQDQQTQGKLHEQQQGVEKEEVCATIADNVFVDNNDHADRVIDGVATVGSDPLDKRNAPCPTNTSAAMTRRSLTVVTRPRALSLDSIQERESNDNSNSNININVNINNTSTSCNDTPIITLASISTPSDGVDMDDTQQQRLRHRSENGTLGLVSGILEALRDLESESESESELEPKSESKTTPLSSQSPSEEDTTKTKDQSENKSSDRRDFSGVEGATSAEASLSAETPLASDGITSDNDHATTNHASTAPSHDAQDPVPSTASVVAPVPPPKPVVDNTQSSPLSIATSAMAFPGAPVTAATIVRKPSTSSSSSSSSSSLTSSSPSPSSASPTTPSSNTSSPTASPTSSATTKSRRKSTKLFGKLVPKFLQTSFASGSGGGISGIALSPHGSGSGSNMDDASKRTTLPALPAIPSMIPEMSALEFDAATDRNDTTTPTSTERRSDFSSGTPSTPPHVSSVRRFSSASEVTKKSSLSTVYSSASSLDPISDSQTTVERVNKEEKGDAKNIGDEQQPQGPIQYEDGIYEEPVIVLRRPAESPYTIDENCDDDFFLNSVLRKSKSPQQQQQTQRQGQIPSPHFPAISTTWKSAATPSMSGTTSQSSSATSSPVSPKASPFSFAFSSSSPLSSSPLSSSQHAKSYSSPVLGSPVVLVGMDEKRARLRDAVGEWRRSNNSSSSSPNPYP